MDSFWVGKTFVRPSVPGDAERIGPNLREIDKLEAMAVLGAGPVDAVRRSLASSFAAWTGEADGVPYACGGLSNYADKVACIWQLGTDDVGKNVKDYLRVGKRIVAQYCKEYELVFNFISVDNRASLRYVEALGFRVTNQTIMFSGHEFVYFERRRSHVC